MSGVKRYTDKPFKAYEYVTEAGDGEYVMFSDYQKLKAENESLRKDAELGRITLKYFDRMDDPADCDPLEKSVSELLAEICSAISSTENL